MTGRGRTDAIAMAGIFAGALALRLVYLWQVESLPFFELPLVDARSYQEWGQAIAAGDWLGDRVFYQAPAYPYFLGVVYCLFGDDRLTVQLVQAVMGALACVFVALATRSMFGTRPALAAGLLLAGYAPAIFFDGMIQKTSLGLLLTTGLLLLLTAFAARPAAARAAAIGVVCALLALTRENALVFALAIPAWLLWRGRGQGRGEGQRQGRRLSARWAWAGAFALGLALVLAPVGFRNLAVGDSFAITTSQLGTNFYIGNNPQATGLYAPLLPGRQTPDFERRDATRAAEWASARELSAGEVSSYWLGRSFEWIREDPGRWLQLSFQKILFTLNDYEIPDTEDIYVHAEFSWLLSVLHAWLRFGVLLPLALAGLVFAWREREGAGVSGLVATLAAIFVVAVAAFYVWSRYRFPLVPLLIPFAGLALVRCFESAAAGEWRRLALPAVALAAAAFVSNLTIFDRELLSQTAWVNLGNIMIRTDRLDEAERYLERAAATPHESADLHFHQAVLRLRQERRPEAEHHLRRMLELDATDLRGHRLLARLLKESGRKKEAWQHLRESIRLDPGRARKGHRGAPLPSRSSPSPPSR